ncbi:MAG: carboxylesterase family protein [Hyphomonadaceae bacterium]
MAMPIPTRRSVLLGGTALLAACSGQTDNPPEVSQAPAQGPGKGPWHQSNPEDLGLSADALNAAADKLAEAGERQGIVVVRNGLLAFEKYWETPYARATPDWQNVSFSSGKSWGSTMVGVAQYKGHLDINDLASKYHPSEVSGLKPDTTIKHLLTMSSGGTMNMKPSSVPPRRLDDDAPPGPGAEYEWYEEAEDGTPEGYGRTIEPGAQFFYDGAPADHLADIVSNAVGKSSHRFMLEEVAAPLGCENFSYQPEGVDHNDNVRIGGSILLSCRDMARLGQLYLNKGQWGGVPILDADYIEAATSPSELNSAYGYLWWLNGTGRVEKAPRSMYFAAGALGQFCFVLPEQDMVIATMASAALACPQTRPGTPSPRPFPLTPARVKLPGDLVMIRISTLLAGAAALTLAACSAPDADAPDTADGLTIQTGSGALVGEALGGVRVFKGVPFAQPPVGELRWRAPQPVSWEGTYEANAFKPACLQRVREDGAPNGGGYAGPVSEDCLYLNIWAPENAQHAPIMVFLFGGGGVVGAGSVATYDGTAFARDGVILATIDYRLGALAGFSHPALTAEAESNGEAHSNYHLLDAIAALQWMKDNAAAFGGDPENILLFGESAGATMTANIATSPLSNGLFQKAIFESTGSLATPATPLATAEERGVAFATELGLDGSEATTAELRTLDAEAIISSRLSGRGHRTILDGSVKAQSIEDAFATGNENPVLVMLGTNSDEGRLRGTQIIADHAMDGLPVWQYFFDYVAHDLREANPNGAPHAGELPFVFDTLDLYPRVETKTDEDQKAADLIHSCWIAFAKAPMDATELTCGDGFLWPARAPENDKAVAIFRVEPSLGKADELRSPPNGAEPGPTSREG